MKLFPLLILTLILACSPEIKYNSVDVNTSQKDLGVDIPINLHGYSSSKNYAYIGWSHPSTDVSFEIYRSTTENSDYQIIAKDVTSQNYWDKKATPSILYYYKVRALSPLYGYSQFTKPVTATRLGMGEDSYEKNDTQDSASYIAIEKNHEASLYPLNDIDWYACDVIGNRCAVISIGKPMSEAELPNFEIVIKSITKSTGIEKILIEQEAQTVDTKYQILVSKDTTFYIQIKSNSENFSDDYRMGDYSISVMTTGLSNMFPLTSDNSCPSFVDLVWGTSLSSLTKNYRIQRRSNNDEWSDIEFCTSPFRIDGNVNVDNIAFRGFDRTAIIDTKYDYRVKAVIIEKSEDVAEFACYSTVATATRQNTGTDTATHTTFETATELSLYDTSFERIVIDQNEHYYKSTLQAGEYKIELTPDSEYYPYLSLSIYNTDKNNLCYIPPNANHEPLVGTTLIVKEQAVYYFKVGSNNTHGKYNININPLDTVSCNAN